MRVIEMKGNLGGFRALGFFKPVVESEVGK